MSVPSTLSDAVLRVHLVDVLNLRDRLSSVVYRTKQSHSQETVMVFVIAREPVPTFPLVYFAPRGVANQHILHLGRL